MNRFCFNAPEGDTAKLEAAQGPKLADFRATAWFAAGMTLVGLAVEVWRALAAML